MDCQVYQVETAAELLGISARAVRNAVRLGRIPSIRTAKRILIPRQALDQMLEGRVACGGTEITDRGIE